MDMSERILKLANDVLCRVAFGRRFEKRAGEGEKKKGVVEVLEETQRLFTGFDAGEFFPGLVGEVVNTFMGLRWTQCRERTSRRELPLELRQSVRRYDQFKWVATQGVLQVGLLKGLPMESQPISIIYDPGSSARLLGWQINLDDIKVESLYPCEMGPSSMSTEDFLNGGQDKDISERVKAASMNGNVLRYVCLIEGSSCQVGLQELSKLSSIGRLRGSNNVVEIYSRCYKESPLVILGAGAGNDTTAAGVLADIVDLQDLFK